MLNFQVFRVKVYPSKEGDLFERERTRSEIIQETIQSLPSAQLRKGMVWHIGNILQMDHTGFYFRVGRTTTATIEIYDELEGNFVDQEFETAPYTHAIIDVDLEVCAIAKKARLSPTTKGIANQLVRLLNEAKRARELRATFEISEILDPKDFIAHLQSAYSITKFWVYFSRPNAWDVDEHFTKPTQRLLVETDGQKCKTELTGNDLKPTPLEEIARSAASKGDDAAAVLLPDKTSRKVKKHLKGNPVNLSQEDVSDNEQKRKLLITLRELYLEISGKRGNNG